MEIERKYLISEIPFPLDGYLCRKIQQGYLSTEPVVRVRRDNDHYYLTYKSSGLMTREEYNLPLTKEAYAHLLSKADGIVITKDRYEIPFCGKFTIELDIFHDTYEGLMIAEVEFETEEDANNFAPPTWFGDDVTFDSRYHNSNMSKSL